MLKRQPRYRHRQALTCGLLQRLANAIWLFWWYRGHFAEGLATLERLLDQTQAVPGSAERAMALHAAGEFAYVRSQLDAAQSFNEQSLAIRRKLGEPAKTRSVK